MSKAPEKLLKLPLWSGDVSVRPLTGGRSNEAYIAQDDKGEYVVRFCHDIPVHHVNRDFEAMVSKASAEAGFSPSLIYYDMPGDEGTMVFEFISAKTYDKEDVADNIERLTHRLRDFHLQVAEKVSGPARLFNVFHVISNYTNTLYEGNSRHINDLCQLEKISRALKEVQIPEHIVFGHNDLVPQNVLDDGEKIWLIDFEYAAFSTPLSDLANLASNAEFTPDQDEHLLQLYYDAPVRPEQKQAMAALKCALMLREAMWSMVSEIHLDVPGVDYELYTGECLDMLNRELETYQTKYGKLRT